MNKYNVTDRNADLEIEAETPLAACEKYVAGGDWGNEPKTSWVTVTVTEIGETESETHTIDIPPTAPDCCGGEHDWASPHGVVGGCRENPGVHGKGGGAIITEVCRHCGCYRITDTWAQNPENGEQGLTSVEYRESDEASEAWLTLTGCMRRCLL